jgi:hypothetical protein
LIVGSLIVLVLGCLTATALWALGGTSAIQARTVNELLSNTHVHPVEATDELCSDPACVEGWRSDVGSFLRFGAEGEAEYWATVLGDEGRRWKNVVLDLRGSDLTFDQKRKAIDILFSARDWS